MTKIIASSSVLLKALKSIAFAHNPAAAKSVPVIDCVRMEVAGNKLKLDTTDLNLMGQTTIEVEAKEAGLVCIPYDKLTKLLDTLVEQPVTLTISGLSVSMMTDNGKYRLAGVDPVDWPKTPEFTQKSIMISTRPLLTAISQVLPFCSKDENRPAMTGVFMRLRESELTVFGCSGLIMAKRVLTLTEDDWGEDGKPERPIECIISNRQAKAMVAVKSPLPFVQLSFSHNSMRVEGIAFAELNITGRLVDQTYPDFDRYILVNNKCLTIGRAELMSTLNRIDQVANQSTHQIRLTMEKNLLTVSTEDMDYDNEGKEDLVCDYEDYKFQISVNLQQLTTCIQSFDDTMIQLNVLASDRALHVRSSEMDYKDPNFSLVMPLVTTE